VITAVYILRVIAILLLGPVRNDHHLSLGDAKWYEKFSAGLLIAGITGIGMAPLWLSDMIMTSLVPIVDKLTVMVIP
jgi:NADH-quinone oxidoreductase subunit M